MKTLFRILFLASMIVMGGCQSSEKIAILDIDKALNDKRIEKLSDYATSLSYIILETTDESLIDEESLCYINFIGENLLIADSRNCFLFDSKGQFIRRIGRQGRGPGEYLSVRRVAVDNQAQRIYISHNAPGILEHDINGNYLKTILPENHLGAWVFMGENIVADLPNYRGDNPYMFAMLDRSGDTIAKTSNYDLFEVQGHPLMFANDPFSFYDDKVNYYRLFNDTVYNIQSGAGILSPKFIFQSTNHQVSRELRSDGAKFASSDDDYIIPWSIIETKNYLFVSALRNQMGLINFLYDKRNGLFYQLAVQAESQQGMVNDIDGGIPFFPQYKMNDNLLCMVLPAHLILERIEENAEFSFDIFSNLTESSNPAIVFLNLK